MGKAKNNKQEKEIQRKPWIPRKTGLVAMTIVSIALALWVGWQVVATEQNIGKGILWGLIFGGSIWLVFLGMNLFHSLFGGKSK
ncbi:MAG TPA: hypothetical protein VMW28_01330 [Pelolinea sp.]|nr:hypothetical protein [Pelolinea sp.]